MDLHKNASAMTTESQQRVSDNATTATATADDDGDGDGHINHDGKLKLLLVEEEVIAQERLLEILMMRRDVLLSKAKEARYVL